MKTVPGVIELTETTTQKTICIRDEHRVRTHEEMNNLMKTIVPVRMKINPQFNRELSKCKAY